MQSWPQQIIASGVASADQLPIPTPPTLAGLFFCLASAEGAGLLFCPVAICLNTSVYRGFYIIHAKLYRQHLKTAHRALQGRFRQFNPFYRRKYKTDTSGYNTTCATLERITAPPAHTRYQIPDSRAGRCTGQRSCPIIIRYIKVRHIADPASPAGSAPAVRKSLASADTLSAVQTRRTC